MRITVCIIIVIVLKPAHRLEAEAMLNVLAVNNLQVSPIWAFEGKNFEPFDKIALSVNDDLFIIEWSNSEIKQTN